MRRPEHRSLWDLTAAAGLTRGRVLADADGCVRLADLASAGSLDVPVEKLRGQSVLISCARQLPFALALLQLDGVAGRIVLCPPDLATEQLGAVMADAEVTAIVSDGTGPAAHRSAAAAGATPVFSCDADPRPGRAIPAAGGDDRHVETEWLLLTSGTSGRPKLVVHTLASLVGPLPADAGGAKDAVWSTFYDVRRYGGLQILLRALLGGGSMVLSQAGEGMAAFLARTGAGGVTHISGTPSHWRLALMSSAADRIAPRYIRLSGEIVDQAILSNLAAAFPASSIAHAFASTEAGVAFEVRDGLAGFPAALIGEQRGGVELRVENGSLRIRSARIARRYLGDCRLAVDADGFLDTGDMLELRDGRCHFVGRREGVINAGGKKVHPEEVEAVINRQRGVQMARVRGRPSPITGALVVADIVVRPSAGDSVETIKADILAACRAALPPHKVPAMLQAVASLDVAGSGKLARQHA
ncbi:MAG TPA: class I adenylate-forming enzyme family protein [Acetobacteraceae bacterium]|nr:class I adenylate-forming enzyme family protein [Acetobacteraceae bacterium]